MLLYEFEGKQLFKNLGINVPHAQLIRSPEELDPAVTLRMVRGIILKAQLLSGKRADSGGIIAIDNQELVADSVKDLFGKTINGQKVEALLVEERIDIDKEYYNVNNCFRTRALAQKALNKILKVLKKARKE